MKHAFTRPDHDGVERCISCRIERLVVLRLRASKLLPALHLYRGIVGGWTVAPPPCGRPSAPEVTRSRI